MQNLGGKQRVLWAIGKQSIDFSYNSDPLLCLTIFIFPLFIDNLLNSSINIYCISSFYIQLSLNLSFPISMKCTKLQVIEKCDITLPWQQNFWISKIFPNRDSHLHCRTMEEKHVLLLFQSAMMHRKVIHVIFFRHICRSAVC